MQDTKSEKIKKADLDPTLRTLGTLTKGGIKLKPTKDKPTTHMLSNKKNLLISDFPKMSYAGYRLGTADGGRRTADEMFSSTNHADIYMSHPSPSTPF